MVQVSTSGHAERDPSAVGAVELVGLVVRVQVGYNAGLLFLPPILVVDV